MEYQNSGPSGTLKTYEVRILQFEIFARLHPKDINAAAHFFCLFPSWMTTSMRKTFVHVLPSAAISLNAPINSKVQHPPGQPPGHLNL